MLTTPHCKKYLFTKCLQGPRTWTDIWYDISKRKRDMRFVTWIVRRVYRAGSVTGAARELARYKLDIVGVQGLSGTKGAL